MDPQGASSPDHIIGQTVGNYLVTSKLGEGGMGSVYLAEHPTIGKKVALKVLHNEFSNNPEVAERFFTEAKSVNAIGHPNIVDIVDYGVLQAGPGGRDRLVYFIMEYLHGNTLSNIIRMQAAQPMAPERALTIAMQVADALAASHKQGIVHRDLKPDNIILIQRGREQDFVKLLDFGIAKLTGNDGMSSHKTRTGLVLGTPAYMSPEQCEGRATVDHRTDIYALGVVLYEMMVGRVPFIGEGYGEILVQHLTQQPAPPSQFRMMSPHLEAVVLKALEKRPDMRYPTMDEFMRAMADSTGYVESHGGLTGFAGKQLMPSTGPIPSIRIATPAPMMTPMPGMTAAMNSPVPGTLAGLQTQTPTTLGAAAGQATHPPLKNKTPFIVAGALVAIGAAVGVFLVVAKGKKSNTAAKAQEGSAVVMKDNGAGSAVPTPNPNPNAGSAAVTPPQPDPPPQNPQNPQTNPQVTPPPNNGSAAVKPPETPNKGSADKPVAANTTVSITSNPTGADIIIDGMPTGKKTPADLSLPHKKMNIVLRLKGYGDFKSSVDVGNDPVKVDAGTLKAVVSSSGGTGSGTSGKGSGSTSGSGKGSGKGKGSAKTCDTCLERPD